MGSLASALGVNTTPAPSASNTAPDTGTASPQPAPTAAVSSAAATPATQAPAAPSPATDLPRFHRTFGSTLKGILLGFEMGGIPGAVSGAISPGRVQQTANDIQTTRHFESLKAAQSVALLTAQTSEANLATQEHQEQLNIMHQSTALWAKRMGLDPTVQVSGTNPQEYDSSAQAAIPAVKAANGGLIPTVVGTNSTIGTGDDQKTHQTTVYAPGTPKSMDGIRSVIEPSTSTVPHMVAEFFRAQGRPVPSDSDWANLGVTPANSGPMQGMQAAAENKIAQRDAIQTAAQFFMTTPTLEGGGNAEQTAAKNNVVLQQVKNQLATYKASGGQDPDTLRQLQTRIDTVENGIKEGVKAGTAAKIQDITATAGPEGQAEGAKAIAAQPGQTQAQIANIRATSGPEAQAAAQKAGAEARAKAQFDDSNVVAFDPSADNGKGANIVMTRGQATMAGLQHYKVDASTVNSTIAGFNDVQNKINDLAAVANNPQRMSQVQPSLAAAMLAHGKGIEIGAFGTKIDTSQVNEALYAEDVRSANQPTRDYVAAMVAAHEAITQLPRLQTFGKSNRMTQSQMEAAQNMLPQPGDDAGMAQQKLVTLQTTLNPLRQALPRMQGAPLIPTWMEQTQQGGFTVTDPRGVVHTFPNQTAADTFKKLAGIK